MREYLQRLLEPAYQVTAVTDGQAALEAARAGPPDILISDVMMPRLGGLQLVAALRADLRTAGRAGAAAVRAGRAGGRDRGPGGRRGRLPGQALRRGRTAGPGPGQPWNWPGCAPTTRAGAPPCSTRCTRPSTWSTRTATSSRSTPASPTCSATAPRACPTRPSGRGGPTSEADPEGHRLATEALARLMTDSTGSFTVPLRHRDGRRVWVTGSFNEVTDPENGRRMVVGTFRDVTTEHYAVQREAALGAMGLMVARAASAAQVLQEALGELARLWRAPEVTAATWTGADQVAVTSTGPARELGRAARRAPRRAGRAAGPAGADPGGRPARRGRHQARASGGHARDLGRPRPRPDVHRRGPHPAQPGRRLSRPGPAPRLPGRPAARDGAGPAARDPRARPGCPPGSPPATSPPPGRSRSAATGTTSSSCRTGGSASWSATASGTTSARPP